MGHTFSLSTYKVKLGVAVKRISGQINKKNNSVKVQRREIAQLLADGKSESARIRVESLFHEQNMIRVLEIVSVVCELLLARSAMIASEKTIPEDLHEPAATIIYCAKRVDVPELMEIAEQLAVKFGEEWAKSHVQNQYDRVNRTVVEKLAVRPPAFGAVMDELVDIAKQFKVEWEPDLDDDASDRKSNPYKLGSIAAIDKKELEATASAIAGHLKDFNGGTMNVTVHECRKLYSTQLFGKMDPYVVLSMSNVHNVDYRTKVMKNAGDHCVFEDAHFPFTVKDKGWLLHVEVFNKGLVTDDFIGRCHLQVDNLIETQDMVWYRIGRDLKQQTFAGEVSITTQFLPFNAPKNQPVVSQYQPVQPSPAQPFVQPMQFPAQPYPQQQQQQQPYPQQPYPQQQPMPQQFMPQPMPYPYPMQQPYGAPMPFQQAPPPYTPTAQTNDFEEPGHVPLNLPSVPHKPSSPAPAPAAAAEDDDLEARFRKLKGF